MDFPNYHLYAEAVAQRGLVVLQITALIGMGFFILIVARQFSAGATRILAYLMAGGYYVTLAVMVVTFGFS